MTNEELMPQYKTGERQCPICAEPLAAHQAWPGARYRFCGKQDCGTKVKELNWGRYVGPRERRCEVEGCSNFVLEGRYAKHPDFLSCSAACWYRRDSKGKIEMTCGCGCGTKFLRRSKRERKNGLYFLNSEHQGRYTTAKNLEKCCGPFRPTLDVYLEAIAARGYRSSSVKVARNNLAPFFLFLNREGIAALNDVTPATITRYLARSKEEGSNRTEHISAISVFFKWLISERRRTTGNPVVRLIHGRRKPHHLPPPLEPDELDFAWELLHERGSALLRFAAAVAEEAGLRVGEICRLRIQDVDIVQQRLFVGLPNKTNTERYAFFDEKTKRYYHEWMAERKADCDHDLVLHNRDGHPLQVDSLITAFRHAMCKVGPRGKATSDIGFDNWSTHRLRHTMASNLVSAGADLATVMAAGGWRSYAAMCGYARVDQEVAKRGYYAAMEAAKEASTLALSNRTLTPAEVLEKCNDLITPQVFSADPSERLRVMDCV